MRRLTATIMALECIVIALAVPVAAQVSGVELRTALTAGGALIGAAVLVIVLLRFRWAYPWGYFAAGVWHACVIATGFAVSVMYFLGTIFAALWATAFWLSWQHRTMR